MNGGSFVPDRSTCANASTGWKERSLRGPFHKRNQTPLPPKKATKSNPARAILDKPLESAHFQGITG
jgi:hypothetical protein